MLKLQNLHICRRKYCTLENASHHPKKIIFELVSRLSKGDHILGKKVSDLRPSCLQATIASRTPQPSPQATPQGPPSNLVHNKGNWKKGNIRPNLNPSFGRCPPAGQTNVHVLADGGHGQLGHGSCGRGRCGAWWVLLTFHACSLHSLAIILAPTIKSALLQQEEMIPFHTTQSS